VFDRIVKNIADTFVEFYFTFFQSYIAIPVLKPDSSADFIVNFIRKFCTIGMNIIYKFWQDWFCKSYQYVIVIRPENVAVKCRMMEFYCVFEDVEKYLFVLVVMEYMLVVERVRGQKIETMRNLNVSWSVNIIHTGVIAHCVVLE